MPVVVSVHDVSFIEHPEYFRNYRAAQLRWTVRRTVRLAGGIVRNSGTLSYTTTAGLEFRLALAAEPGALDYGFRGSLQPFGAPEMDEVELFRDSLAVGPRDGHQRGDLAARACRQRADRAGRAADPIVSSPDTAPPP